MVVGATTVALLAFATAPSVVTKKQHNFSEDAGQERSKHNCVTSAAAPKSMKVVSGAKKKTALTCDVDLCQ